VTMLHYLTPLTSASLGLNGALWTLALEAQWYLLLPLIAPWLARRPWPTAAGLFALAVAWRWLSWHDLEWLVALEMTIGAPWSPPEAKMRHLIATQLPSYLGHFAVGMLAARAWLAWRGRAHGPLANAACAIAAALAVFVLYRMHAPGGVWLGEFNWVLIPLTMGVLVLALVSTGSAVGMALLGNAPLQLVGRASYSIYLYHLPLLLAWNKLSPIDGWAALPVYLALVLAVGHASWRWVEQPYLRGWRAASGPAGARADRERGDDGEALEQRHAP
jgi:peptidoglycan/LPS O-acetylase OafA/YrhL